ncbi:DEAD/DEAH box helicase family protein [Lutibacter sp. B2]|nr:DEAD/DEAH box helicase family protein [Lutibacter sp. B2]
MKLIFKEQQFQLDAIKSVVDCFSGQVNQKSKFTLERLDKQIRYEEKGNIEENIGYRNKKIQINETAVLQNIKKTQRKNNLHESEKLDGMYNITVEMETGTGKTYTYIRTMYELHKKYGWSKFIIVIPSVAIREGVYKTFEITKDHFMEIYGHKINAFIYNSKQLHKIEDYASTSKISVMIINSQAFNARGKDARRIYMELDEFGSRKPIDVLAQTNPIVIIDEPQSVEGKKTKESLKDFNPLCTLRYSATHKEDFNKVYRLDALDAYNEKLVKKIKVKGINVKTSTGTDSYLYLEKIKLSKGAPVAMLEHEKKTNNGIKKVLRPVTEGYNLYQHSENMEEYRGYTVSEINGFTNTVKFLNGEILTLGEARGDVNELTFRRIQIRETIKSHFKKEKELFHKGIKVLSLFFIDEVAKYRRYDEDGNTLTGEYEKIFEEEYTKALNEYITLEDSKYNKYLKSINVKDTHKGYFSIDKKNRMIDSKLKRSETSADDVDAYTLIMKDKETLLSFKEPTRFIFSHSALKEGWDNPNVFQICTLKHSDSTMKKRQEVGRGLRLCVNQKGERMDEFYLEEDVHKINELTVIASESYESFAKGLQNEIAETLSDRPKKADDEFFLNKIIKNARGEELKIDKKMAKLINKVFYKNDYIDDEDKLTDTYFEAVENGTVEVPKDIEEYKADIIELVKGIYVEGHSNQVENDREGNIEKLEVNANFQKEEFQTLWKKINIKSAYEVKYDTEKLINNSISALDHDLEVSEISYQIREGTLENTENKETLATKGFKDGKMYNKTIKTNISEQIKYDLIGELVDKTNLTRKTVIKILTGIRPETFYLFKRNPEEFIIKAARLINDKKAALIVESITYSVLDDTYDTRIFIENKSSGKLGQNAIEVNRHIYDYLIYDSKVEKDFADILENTKEVLVYAKLPRGFKISTPVGNYSPDWAIAFDKEQVKHIYFIAETKGTTDKKQRSEVENLKIECAKKHFAKISNDTVKYKAVATYDDLLSDLM